MWQRLSKANWPESGDYHWVRKGTDIWIALFNGMWIHFPGTSLWNQTYNDHDIGEWEFFDKKIEEPTVSIQGFLPFI